MNHNEHEGQANVTPPPPISGGINSVDQHSWVLQCLTQIQSSVGGLQSDISHLSEKVGEQSSKIDAHIDKVDTRLGCVERKLLVATTVVITTGILLSGFIGFAVYTFDKAWDYALIQQQDAATQQEAPIQQPKKKAKDD